MKQLVKIVNPGFAISFPGSFSTGTMNVSATHILFEYGARGRFYLCAGPDVGRIDTGLVGITGHRLDCKACNGITGD